MLSCSIRATITHGIRRWKRWRYKKDNITKGYPGWTKVREHTRVSTLTGYIIIMAPFPQIVRLCLLPEIGFCGEWSSPEHTIDAGSR